MGQRCGSSGNTECCDRRLVRVNSSSHPYRRTGYRAVFKCHYSNSSSSSNWTITQEPRSTFGVVGGRDVDRSRRGRRRRPPLLGENRDGHAWKREPSGRRAPIETACRRRDGRPEPQAIELSTPRPARRSGGSRQTADPQRGGSTAGASGPHTHQWALRSGHLTEGRPSSITFRSRDAERVFPTDIVHTRPPKLDVRDADETDVPASSFDKCKRVRQTVARTEPTPIDSSNVVTTATLNRGASNGAPHERHVGD